MKYLLFVFITSVILGCSREQAEEPLPPSAQIITATKVYSGGNPSIKITYRLNNTSSVAKTIIANLNYGFSGSTNAELPTVDGEAIVYDHGNSNTSANYYFIFNLKNGTQVTSQIMTFYF